MAAANAGKQVLLVEADAELGGGLLSERAEVEGLTPAAWRDRMLAALSAMPNVTVMNRTMAFGFYDHQLVGLCRSEEHTSELQSLMRISYAVFCLQNKKKI